MIISPPSLRSILQQSPLARVQKHSQRTRIKLVEDFIRWFWYHSGLDHDQPDRFYPELKIMGWRCLISAPVDCSGSKYGVFCLSSRQWSSCLSCDKDVVIMRTRRRVIRWRCYSRFCGPHIRNRIDSRSGLGPPLSNQPPRFTRADRKSQIKQPQGTPRASPSESRVNPSAMKPGTKHTICWMRMALLHVCKEP